MVKKTGSLIARIGAWYQYDYGLPFTVWCLFQVALCVGFFCMNQFSPTLATARSVMGYGLMIARGSAGVLNVNSCIMVMTMCRLTLTQMARVRFLRKLFWLDHITTLHKWTGMSLIFFTALHVIAHVFNYIAVSATSTDSMLRSQKFVQLFFMAPTGITGIFITLILLVIGAGSALRRRMKHEIFYYTHYLILPYYIFLMTHGTFCFIKMDADPAMNQSMQECICSTPLFWRLFLLPGLIYAVERLVFQELLGRINSARIRKVKVNPGDILEIQFEKSLLKAAGIYNYKAGQYVNVNVPQLSLFQ